MQTLTRRGILSTSVALGCSLAASPFFTPITLAAAPWDSRLVVIILRGAMDGLGVVQPYGDRDFSSLRSNSFGDTPNDLDGFFALHSELGSLMPLWRGGELAFAHAVSTPYRDKRSHFDGQDLLEAGTGSDVEASAMRDGWLNRMVQRLPGVTAETAFSIGQDELKIFAGSTEISSWTPESKLKISDATEALIAKVSASDPLFSDSFENAVSIANKIERASQESQNGEKPLAPHIRIAEFTAGRLLENTRVAAFSINGWDTHFNQQNTLKRPLRKLAETIISLRNQLGPVWEKTAVLAMTEFGRTVRENGSGGTDHGTGGAMVMAGGAVNGGRVYGKWPGLGAGDLYSGRDLMPTADVRAFAAMSMQGLFSLDRSTLENHVFPGLDIAGAPKVIL